MNPSLGSGTHNPTPEEIAEVFQQLGLETEDKRARFQGVTATPETRRLAYTLVISGSSDPFGDH